MPRRMPKICAHEKTHPTVPALHARVPPAMNPALRTSASVFSTENSPRAKIFLRKGRANPVWRGHPWIFAGAVERNEGELIPGALVDVFDTSARLIGPGFVNPRSQIIVRMLGRGTLDALAASPDAVQPADAGDVAAHLQPAHAPLSPPQSPLAHLLTQRITQCLHRRQLMGLPRPDTTAFRLVNSEGDGLPGLIVDVYGETAAVQFTALGMKQNEATVFAALAALPHSAAGPEPLLKAIVEVGAGSFAKVEGFAAATRVVLGEPERLHNQRCVENGVQFNVDLEGSQKTGLFLDQRENRRRLATYCKDAAVLDVYSYVGGFALTALRHGARSAVAVDASARALAKVTEHAALNGLGPIETIEADAFRYLEGVTPYRFDVVVLDPPKFARAQRDVEAAMKGYQRLNALGMNAVRRGGLLATCSCSQLVDVDSFERMIAAAAQDAGRRVTVLETSSQGPDHPLLPAFPEGRYLKYCLLGLD